VLFRAMVPLIPEKQPKIPSTPVLISNGKMDPLVSAEETERLAALLRFAGADVTLSWQTSGHDLTERDVITAREWVAQRQAR
jgi:predicted esterase